MESISPSQFHEYLYRLDTRLSKIEALVLPPPEPPPTEPPKNTDAPYVSGVGAVGEMLSCTMGNWEGVPTFYSYKWKSKKGTQSAVDIGQGPNYTIQDNDLGASITCVVTATNDIGSTDAPPSNAIAVPAAGVEEKSADAKPPPKK